MEEIDVGEDLRVAGWMALSVYRNRTIRLPDIRKCQEPDRLSSCRDQHDGFEILLHHLFGSPPT